MRKSDLQMQIENSQLFHKDKLRRKLNNNLGITVTTLETKICVFGATT